MISITTTVILQDMYTLWRCKRRRRSTLSVWINIGNGKGSSSWVQQQSENMQASRPWAPDPWPLNPKSIGFDSVVDYYCAKFPVILIRGFRFIMLTYPHTHIHHDKVITISAPPYYVPNADTKGNKSRQIRL